MTAVAVIPARGGSKGLPDKNTRILARKPLIVHTIELALRCESIGQVLVSSDDDETIEIALNAGADAPFRRPPHLATDDASSLDVVLHALAFAPQFNVGVLLQPTSPVRELAHLEEAVTLVEKGLCDFAVSVREVRDHPSWMWRIDPAGELGKFDLSADADRRQLLEPLYVPNGSVYAFRCEALMRHQRFIGPGTRPIVMDELHSIDIDTEFDLEFAEFVIGRGSE